MNYSEWADEYLENADRVLSVIEKKKALLNDKKLDVISKILSCYNAVNYL